VPGGDTLSTEPFAPPALEAVRRRRAEILRLAARYSAGNVRVFGSVARGDASSESDIDLLVEFEPGRSLLDLVGLELDLRDLLGLHVDVATVASLKDRIRPRVLAEAVPL
jgi:predicted nucleotidyltransferase